LKIAHVITGLNVGGAEMMLYRLIATMDRTRFTNAVISLTDVGPIGKDIQKLGIRVSSVGLGRALPNPLGVFRLSSMLKKMQPDVIQTWMLHGDFVGGIAGYLAGRIPVLWGIHHTTFDPRHTKWTSRATLWGCRALARRIPTKIVCCSNASLETCKELGYDESKMVVISNGFDDDEFYRDPDGAAKVRAELGIAGEAPIIGLVARFHPQKDHETFFQAAEMLLAKMPEAHFILCGDGVTDEQSFFREKLRRSRRPGSFHLLGRRSNLRKLMSAFTVGTLTSAWGEAFPLVLGEAMCCEVPCVTTNVGDARRIVEGTGRVVQPKDPSALCIAWMELLSISESERRALGRKARAHIRQEFGLKTIASRYEALYDETAQASKRLYQLAPKRANDMPSCADV
jgi:glycosyltransferase involved in cell wall biosynthesis